MNERTRLIRYWSKENIIQQKKGYFDYVTRRMFDQYLTDCKQKTTLDVGCGLGMSMDYFTERDAIVKGIDITPQSVKTTSKRGLCVMEADARQLPFKNNSFDIVYSIGVIEHFRETQMALKEQARVCRPGGTVVAVVPNMVTPYSIGMILFEIFSGRARHSMLTTCGKSFSRSQFRNMFKKAGCRDVTIQPYYGSAILRLLFNNIYKGLTDRIENSTFSKMFGLVLWGIGYKT